MLLKAGLIGAVFLHMAWERLALIYAIPPSHLCLVVLIGVSPLAGVLLAMCVMSLWGRIPLVYPDPRCTIDESQHICCGDPVGKQTY